MGYEGIWGWGRCEKRNDVRIQKEIGKHMCKVKKSSMDATSVGDKEHVMAPWARHGPSHVSLITNCLK